MNKILSARSTMAEFKATLYFSVLGKHNVVFKKVVANERYRSALQGLYDAEEWWRTFEGSDAAADKLIAALKVCLVEAAKIVGNELPTPEDIDRILAAAEVHES